MCARVNIQLRSSLSGLPGWLRQISAVSHEADAYDMCRRWRCNTSMAPESTLPESTLTQKSESLAKVRVVLDSGRTEPTKNTSWDEHCAFPPCEGCQKRYPKPSRPPRGGFTGEVAERPHITQPRWRANTLQTATSLGNPRTDPRGGHPQ